MVWFGDARRILVEGVCSQALSDDSEDHSELVCNETLAPQVISAVEHVCMLERGEPDAVQVEAPDHHLCVVSGGREERIGGEEGEEEEWVGGDMDRSEI